MRINLTLKLVGVITTIVLLRTANRRGGCVRSDIGCASVGRRTTTSNEGQVAMKKIVLLISLLGAAVLGSAGSAQADTFGSRPIHNSAHSFCLDGWWPANTNGTWVTLWSCNGGANQHWVSWGDATKDITPLQDPFPNTWGPVVNQQVGLCLDAMASQDWQNGDPVMLWQCNGGANQNWELTASGQIINQAHGLCLDAAWPAASNGTHMQLWSCWGGPNQAWSLPLGMVVQSAPGKCLDDTNWSTSPGQQLQLWGCTGNVNQDWTPEATQSTSISKDGIDLNSNYETLRNNYSGMCVDNWYNSTTSGSPAVQWPCSTSDPAEAMNGLTTTGSNWESGYQNASWPLVVNPLPSSGLCLDDHYGNPNDGAPVDFWSCNSTVSQQWFNKVP